MIYKCIAHDSYLDWCKHIKIGEFIEREKPHECSPITPRGYIRVYDKEGNIHTVSLIYFEKPIQ
jgi:hypothetical protein